MHKKVVLWNFAYAIKGSAAHIIRKLKKKVKNTKITKLFPPVTHPIFNYF